MRARAILLAALLLPLPAAAQYRVGDGGRALDANPRLGSGGYNSGIITDNVLQGNRIVTGNVTGGKEFRGGVPYSDPREFRGPASTDSMDRFIRSSAGAGDYGQSVRTATEVQPYYGGRLANPQSADVVRSPNTGTYTPAASNTAGPTRLPLYDPRLGPLQVDQAVALPSGDLIIPGPLDPITNEQVYYTASPLTGVRPLRPEELAERGLVGLAGARSGVPAGQVRLDAQAILQARRQLNEAAGQPEPRDSGNMARPMPQSFDTPAPSLLRSEPLTGQIDPGLLGSNGRMVALAPPSKQSRQNAELERRLNQYYSDLLLGQELKYGDQIRQLRRQPPADGAGPALPGPGATPPPVAQEPDYARIAREILAGMGDTVRPTTRPDTVRITALAAGINAGALADWMSQGEALMREGKYDAALAAFDAALAIAPNNAMIQIGRAHAALGAGYFVRAEQSLRLAMATDPAVFLARYDLAQALGSQRLEEVVRHIKEGSLAQTDSAVLPMLLAYVAWQVGQEEQCGLYLDLAQQRSAGRDEFYKLVRLHWQVPSQLEAEYVAISLTVFDAQLQRGNIARLRYEPMVGRLTGEFRQPVEVAGLEKAVLKFRTEVPRNAQGALFLEYIRSHAQGAELDLGDKQ